MELSYLHITAMLLTMIIILGGGVIAARRVRTSTGFSLNGRQTSAPLVAGAIAGASIGGGSTIGTAQLAFSVGLSAIWFTLGVGIGLIFMATALVRPLRESGCETISQILIRNYGAPTGQLASIIASVGIFFSCLASVLPAIYLLAVILDLNIYLSGLILMILISSYIYFGGMKGAAISGILKTVFLWSMLVVVTILAIQKLNQMPDTANAFKEDFWFDLFGQGYDSCLENLLSLIVGMTASQTYAQALFAAKDVKAARVGAIAAAIVSMPVGIPCVLAAMYMHASDPQIQPILALPTFVVTYMPPALAGITLGALLMSLISSVSGLTFGISTMLSRDVLGALFKWQDDEQVLRANKLLVILISMVVITYALTHLNSQILMWNFFSMSLRGSFFIPLIMAIFKCRKMPSLWAIPAIAISAFFAATAKDWFNLPYPPLFIAFAASALVIIIGILASPGLNHQLLKITAKSQLWIQHKAGFIFQRRKKI